MLSNGPRVAGTLVGCCVTIAAAALCFGLRVTEMPELLTYNTRVLFCNTIQADERIVHVDIDDGSLEEIGRWPWPRWRLAELISAIDELDASYIMVDLLLSERQRPSLDDPRLTRDSDIDPTIQVVGEVSDRNIVYGDLELAAAIREAGNVIMAVQLDTLAPDAPDTLRRRVRRLWEQDQAISPESAAAGLGLEASPSVLDRIRTHLVRLNAYACLMQEFTLTAPKLADCTAADPEAVDAVIAGAKKMAATERVAQLFSGGADPTIHQVRAAILGVAQDRHNADRSDVDDAFRTQLGLRSLEKSLSVAPAAMSANDLHRAMQTVPLYYRFADAALDVAAVNFMPDADGTVRRVPPLIGYGEDHLIKHLGFAAAAHILNLDVDGGEMRGARTMCIPRRDGGDSITLPLDGYGNLIIPWTATGRYWREGRDFPHISAAKLLTIADARRQMRNNQTMIDYLMADVVAASKGTVRIIEGSGDSAESKMAIADNAFRQRVNERLQIESELCKARLMQTLTPEKIARLKSRAEELAAIIHQDEAMAVAAVKMNWRGLQDIPADEIEGDAELQSLMARFEPAHRILQESIPRLREANEKLQASIDKTKSELVGRIKDRYVFVGFAATAQGDIVSTPIDKSTNGVMCHANVLNAFLQGRFITPTRFYIDLAVCLTLGLLVSVITAIRGPRLALLATLGVIGLYIAMNCLILFRQRDVWSQLAAVIVVIAVVWAFVTLFRQLTAERDKRLFRIQLSQYTSPAIAERIAESPSAAQAFKAVQTRDVTCYFSDLKGFTSITETEDAEVVQHVLNTYLERMSRVIWSHRGLINKFMGDGIMAFFNPSVDPLSNHAHAACEAALDTFDELDRLKRTDGDPAFVGILKQLEMRVGIATGACMNGDMGSELKADYTVIGDVVNLAARLEPANKVFGTRLMVSGPVRDEVKDAYEFRYLAELQVKGKRRTVPVYEIVCRRGQLDEDGRAYIDRFEAGVELYKQRKWDECIVHFTRMLARRYDDLGASRYIDACQEFKTFPPEADWTGALELKEK